ncbi:hypothetical protein [Shewanella algae]|uniref:hypothetical protein n=1 Tax=Shewanella algae TaxID=38313 RepID=UPI000B9CEA86|nr:hypothetical protein [Shewanella algae]OXS02680.1 hypothetical protein AMR44_00970 [Shewanella algae]
MFINPYLLSEPRLYKWLVKQLPLLLKGQATIDRNEIKKIAYAGWHRRYQQHGDQLFNTHWLQLEKRQEEYGSLTRALLGQVARYHFESYGKLAVKLKRFDEWQTWIANQSGLPVIAYQAEKTVNERYSPVETYQWLESQLGYRCLLSPFHPSVEDYIEQHGLSDTHIHLNGTSSLESMWNFALSNPKKVISDLTEEYVKPRVQLLYSCSPELDSPYKYEKLLLTARYVRRLIIAWVRGHGQLSEFKQSLADFLEHGKVEGNILDWLLEEKQFNVRWTHLAEIELHISVQRKLKEHSDASLDYCYLVYLLCMNNFQRLMVQRDDQFGFEQFQKFADNGVRESYEKSYIQRFYQLHGPILTGRPDLLVLEGRFTPKKSLEKNEALVGAILRGFITYATGQIGVDSVKLRGDLNSLALEVLKYRRPSLKLVAHFIKFPSDPKKEFHYSALRQTLINNGEILFDLLNKYPSLKGVITGIDAAANELEAPPEVFAPLYRRCRSQGLSNATYHVGEDFEHLLSGIRAIFEAITFLELKAGDRLGHATAIGIDPQYWLDLMPEQLFLARGQYFEDLLFLRSIALSDPNSSLPLAKLEARILATASDIFDVGFTLSDLSSFFDSRNLEPSVVKALRENHGSFSHQLGHLHNEYLLAQRVSSSVQELLYKRWFNKEVLLKYCERVEIPLSMFSYKELLEVQQYVQKLVSEKHIVLETLPTSNVRISHYNSIKDHHVFRWLRVPSKVIQGDSPMLVTLGSDDPGIFATDMRNEFYHIFGTLVENFGYPVNDALELTSRLNENGRVYHFKPTASHFHSECKPIAEM